MIVSILLPLIKTVVTTATTAVATPNFTYSTLKFQETVIVMKIAAV